MTVKRVEVLAYAKINLMLDIIRRRRQRRWSGKFTIF